MLTNEEREAVEALLAFTSRVREKFKLDTRVVSEYWQGYRAAIEDADAAIMAVSFTLDRLTTTTPSAPRQEERVRFDDLVESMCGALRLDREDAEDAANHPLVVLPELVNGVVNRLADAERRLSSSQQPTGSDEDTKRLYWLVLCRICGRPIHVERTTASASTEPPNPPYALICAECCQGVPNG